MDILSFDKNKNLYYDRIEALRALMRSHHVDVFMIPTSDYHNSEYVGDCFKVREYFSGFTGSNGTLVVTLKEAALWTDGRYFIQAKKELEGSGVFLQRMGDEGVPTISDFLLDKMEEGTTLAVDGRVICASEGVRLYKKLEGKKISVRTDIDPASPIWKDRPPIPHEMIYIIDEGYAGQNVKAKLDAVRKIYKANGADAVFISKLDDIMWLYNIRGNDVMCNPVAMSYTYITDDEAHLFIQSSALSKAHKVYFDTNEVCLHEYSNIQDYLEAVSLPKRVSFDCMSNNVSIYRILENKTEIIDKPNPTERLKAIKNPIESQNIRKVYEADSAALTRFIYWVKNVENLSDYNEYSAACVLDGMREKLPGFIELSFPTISAYKENAAMMHYEATPDNNMKLSNEGMLLVDSGAQYMGGTTDVTRTIVLGEITDEMRKHYTLVTVGMLRLSATTFLKGCTGRNLDILAREPLWNIGIDYKCGTGHGIGYILNVHEGPQNIRWRYIDGAKEAVLEPGMIISDEPGVYIEGSHGIRIENIIEVCEKEKNGDGEFLCFNHLTFVPIDLEAIDIRYMDNRDVELLNQYHNEVYRRMLPYMTTESEKIWLKNATKAI